jgi:hypothetical protein
MDMILPASFDQLWAVVAYDRIGGGRRLLWSSAHRAWLPSIRSVRGRPWFTSTPVDGHEGQPYEDELEAIPGLVDKLLEDRICQRCGLSDVGDHFVAPNVHGDAALYCLQMPDPRVVESSGGQGMRKHWGTMFGCSAVRQRFLMDDHGSEHIDFGRALVASHVRDWEWCNRCIDAAADIRRAARTENQSPEKYVRDQERQLLRTRRASRAQYDVE